MRSLDDLKGRMGRGETVRFPSGRKVSNLGELEEAYKDEETLLAKKAKDAGAKPPAAPSTPAKAKEASTEKAKTPAEPVTATTNAQKGGEEEEPKTEPTEPAKTSEELEAEKAEAASKIEARRKELTGLKVDELTQVAGGLEVEGADKLVKSDLIEAILAAEAKDAEGQ